MSNEWKRPSTPPPPLFLGKKERDLVKQINDELIEKVIGQQILYSFKGILIAHAGASYFSMVSALCLLITSFLCFRQKNY